VTGEHCHDRAEIQSLAWKKETTMFPLVHVSAESRKLLAYELISVFMNKLVCTRGSNWTKHYTLTTVRYTTLSLLYSPSIR